MQVDNESINWIAIICVALLPAPLALLFMHNFRDKTLEKSKKLN